MMYTYPANMGTVHIESTAIATINHGYYRAKASAAFYVASGATLYLRKC